MTDRRPGPQPALTTRTVAAEELYGEDLTGRTEHRVRYIDVDLTESSSSAGLVFDECVFRNVRFNASSQRGAAFTNCTFSRCNFFDARFTDCKLVGSRFEGCSFEHLQVSGGDWSFVGLGGADLRNVSFTDARMREVDLVRVRGDAMTIRRSDLSGSQLAKCCLDRADLRGSDVSAIDPWAVSLRGTIVDGDQALILAMAFGLDVRPE